MNNNNKNGSGGGKYRLAGLLASALAAVVCFFAYFKGGRESYAPCLFFAAACFAVVGTSELLLAKATGAGGVFQYLKPALFYIIAVFAAVFAVAVLITGGGE